MKNLSKKEYLHYSAELLMEKIQKTSNINQISILVGIGTFLIVNYSGIFKKIMPEYQFFPLIIIAIIGGKFFQFIKLKTINEKYQEKQDELIKQFDGYDEYIAESEERDAKRAKLWAKQKPYIDKIHTLRRDIESFNYEPNQYKLAEHIKNLGEIISLSREYNEKFNKIMPVDRYIDMFEDIKQKHS